MCVYVSLRWGLFQDLVWCLTWCGTLSGRVINAGKSRHNEDQACCEVVYVESRRSRSVTGVSREPSHNQGFCFYYWGLFDGHAGGGAAEMASRLLHRHIREQLKDLVEILKDPLPPPLCLPSTPGTPGAPSPSQLVSPQSCWSPQKEVTHDSLIVGAIENAFHLMDEQMARERRGHQVEGGCCALVVLYLLGKMYVANAGDSRAIIVRNGEIIPMSREFTPETERQRLQLLGFLKPELLGSEFTHLEFPRRVQPKELGQRMLYRDQNMTGWAYKKIEVEDLRFPLVCGEGKKARVMATIGVTRGLGDHNLKVRVYDLTQYEHCPDDVLVLGTDGLWDVTNDSEVAATVDRVLSSYEPNDPSRYTALAQALVLGARGIPRDRGWRLPNNKLGSGDDISVFVIPLGGPGSSYS